MSRGYRKPRPPRHPPACETCGSEYKTRWWKIDMRKPKAPRNRITMCERCCSMAETGEIKRGVLSLIANEREDAILRNAMDHDAYAVHAGATRQVHYACR